MHLDSGWVPADTRIDQLETAIRTVCEPIFNKPLAEISFAQMLMRLFKISQRFNVEIQPQMILLHKTLFNIEGLGRQLYPQLDLWKTAHPVLKRWMNEKVGPRAVLNDLRDNLPQLRSALLALPAIIEGLGERSNDRQADSAAKSAELQLQREQSTLQRRQSFWLTIAATTAIAGTSILMFASMPAMGLGLLVATSVATVMARP